MGKNRKTTKTTYNTGMDEYVDMTGHTEEFMENLEYHIDKWLWGDYNDTNIIYHMSSDEIHYLISHMLSTQSDAGRDMVPTGHLTRVELKYHASGLKEGDTIEGRNLFRGFSRKPESTSNIISSLQDYYGTDVDDYVIYRTLGDVPFFDPTKFSDPFPNQTEVFVPVDTMKVSKIHEVTDTDELFSLTGMDTEIPPNRTVKVVDITPDSSVKSVPVTLSTGETTIKYDRK